MKHILSKVLGVIALLFAGMLPMHAQTDFSTFQTGIGTEVTAIATAGLAVAVLGISIFAVRFGVRVLKGVLKAAS